MIKTIQKEFDAHLQIAQLSYSTLPKMIDNGAKLILKHLRADKKLLIFGNGGSAADAQHFSAELINRYKIERKALPAIALTTDSSILTSISNDYDYNMVFARQIEALANKKDIVFAISTSGNSKSIIQALKMAKKKKCKIIGLSGNDGGDMKEYCDINIVIPSNETPRIQEMHIFVIHTICELIDQKFKG